MRPGFGAAFSRQRFYASPEIRARGGNKEMELVDRVSSVLSARHRFLVAPQIQRSNS
jgi:hypothetical protein